MNKIVSCLMLSLFLVACSSVPAVPEEVSEKKVDVKLEEPEKEYKDIEDVKDVVVSADSFLVDNTNIGFNYEAGMVMDQDFSTAWCSEKGGKSGELTMDFADYVQADKVGILPGFGRDENIYSKNNRIKSLGVTFDEGEEQIFDFDDSYRMHFVDLNEAKFKKVKFVVKDIYKGSKYNDTCISEVDFWSDFVAGEDSQAAMNYYVKYKKDFAMKPYDVVSSVLVSDLSWDKCGDPVKSTNAYYENLYPAWFLPAGVVYISGILNEYAIESDKLTLKVYYNDNVNWDEAPEGVMSIVPHDNWVFVNEEEVKPEKSCSGKLYVKHKTKFKETFGIGGLGQYEVQILNEGKIVGRESYFLTQ